MNGTAVGLHHCHGRDETGCPHHPIEGDPCGHPSGGCIPSDTSGGTGGVARFAAAIEPGSTAVVLIWENRWAAPFASAARRAGGQLIANGRIPIQAIIASTESFINIIDEGA